MLYAKFIAALQADWVRREPASVPVSQSVPLGRGRQNVHTAVLRVVQPPKFDICQQHVGDRIVNDQTQ
jgi:hypothetical protein